MDNNIMIILQHFFVTDLKIKEEMYNIAPPMYVSDDSILKYSDQLNNSLIYIFTELKCIAKDLFSINSLVWVNLSELEKTVMSNFYNCGLDLNKLRSFYQKYISNMDIDFLNKTKQELVGYKLYSDDSALSMITSLNEMLHYIHCYILNNENILQSVPMINQKINSIGNSITLRGVSSNVFNDLFLKFPLDLEVGITDMISISSQKLIMMVRDLGHALTLEITVTENIARVEYFIPKLCNIDMINHLPGINSVNENSIGATGVFETSLDLLPNSLYDFLSKVPTDEDMELKNN
jgi:hypothetical protein